MRDSEQQHPIEREDRPPRTEGGPRELRAEGVARTGVPTGSPDEVQRHWVRLQEAVRARVQPEQFETWFRRAALTRLDDEVVSLAVQNSFARDWLNAYYKGVVAASAKELVGGSPRVEIVVDPELVLPVAVVPAREANGSSTRSAAEPADPDTHVNGAGTNGHAHENGARRAPASNGHEGAPQDSHPHTNLLARGSDIGLNPNYTFENFVVGPCNRFAHAAAVGVAESPGRVYNPLFLHGSVGLGKTHLLQSISFSLLESRPGIKILFLTCETFVNHFISALENGDLQKFRNKYRNVDVLVVDDIHLLANKERTQEEFFHTFNSLYNAGKQIVLSSDTGPREIPTLQERLVSRFKWGLVTEVERPCYETRMAILKRKSRERGREIPEEVAQLMTERIDQNIRELEGAVTKLLSYANVTGQPVSIDLARKVLGELFTTRRGQPSMEEILKLVTEEYGVKLSDLQSKRRTNAIAYPRQIGMYLARKVTRHSLEEIGGFFGGRDHSTVLYAVEKIGRLIKEDPECRERVGTFLDQLQSPPV